MTIRLIAVDLDDTLLRHDLSISERSMHAINQARARGILVTVATGRVTRTSLRYVSQLQINIPFISSNGAMIQEALTGEILYRKMMDSGMVSNVIRRMQEEEMHSQIYLGEKIYTNGTTNPWVEDWHQHTTMQPEKGDLLALLAQAPEGVEKVVSIHEPAWLYEKYQLLKTIFAGRIHITLSKPHFMEMNHPEVNKGTAVAYLAQRHGIPREEIMVIGDSLNDLEMIRYAGIGVAMGNAREEVKGEADYVTGTNNEDGVAQAIEKFALNDT